MTVTIDARHLGTVLEHEMPAGEDVLNGPWQTQRLDGGHDLKFVYAWKRSPLLVGLQGNRVALATRVRSAIVAEVPVAILPDPTARCGVGRGRPIRIADALAQGIITEGQFQNYRRLGIGSIRPLVIHNGLRMDLKVDISFTVEPTWHLRAGIGTVDVESLDECHIRSQLLGLITLSSNRIDERIAAQFGRQMQSALGGIQERMDEYDLRSRAEDLWNALESPHRIDGEYWLTVAPQAVHQGPFSSDASGNIQTTFAIIARPQIENVSEQPEFERRGLPLKQDAAVPVDDLHLFMDVHIAHSDIQRFGRAVVGEWITFANRRLRIDSLSVAGLPDGRLLVGIDFTSPRGFLRKTKGRAYFVGTPAWDGVRRSITFPDLAFEARTDDPLVNTYLWLKDEELARRLRAAITIDVGRELDNFRDRAESAVRNRDLGSGAIMEGGIRSTDVLGVWATEAAVNVRFQAMGSLQITLPLVTTAPAQDEG